MKTYLLFLLVLIGCSKTTIQPDITGHWIGASSRFSVDMVITKSGTSSNVTYNITGTFSIDGKSSIITQSAVGQSPGSDLDWTISFNQMIGVPPVLMLYPVRRSSDYNTLTVQNETISTSPGQLQNVQFDLKRK